MIPRILVPRDARLAADAGAPAPRRLYTALDSRTLIAPGSPTTPLDARTSIPAYLPLDVLAARVVVPRDMPATPLEATSAIPLHVPLTVLDSRVAVPKDLLPVRLEPKGPVSVMALSELLEPDIITTGELNLMVRPVKERASNWRWVARVSSIVFHSALVIFVLWEPKLFPYRPPTQAEMELARQRLSFVYLPPSVTEVPRVAPQPSERTSPQMRIDPRVLREVAPPNPELQPLPGQPERERVTRDLPAAPTPQLENVEPQPRSEVLRETARVQPQNPREGPNGLVLPRISPGKALEESVREAMKGGGSPGGQFGGPVPRSPGGGGQGYLGGAVQMLTPDEGVDFSNYLARVLASVKRNWYSVIPESARLGEKGRVILRFRIQRDGNVPFPEPILEDTSGKEPLDRAALSSIRGSSPFEPLPPAFSGPFIELRFIFLYNLPLNYAQ
jgi:outer membrane biosynthesis protein TonB